MGADTNSRYSHQYIILYSGIGVARSEVIYEPLGVALVISAWNYPIYTAIPQVAAAIAAGNCVILKPSEFAPYTSNVLSMLF
jgi:aldehyde dehydrogenase (NAD+)